MIDYTNPSVLCGGGELQRDSIWMLLELTRAHKTKKWE